MQAAMRSVEDETDAAAAAALEQENAAELAEFTMEPAARVSSVKSTQSDEIFLKRSRSMRYNDNSTQSSNSHNDANTNNSNG